MEQQCVTQTRGGWNVHSAKGTHRHPAPPPVGRQLEAPRRAAAAQPKCPGGPIAAASCPGLLPDITKPPKTCSRCRLEERETPSTCTRSWSRSTVMVSGRSRCSVRSRCARHPRTPPPRRSHRDGAAALRDHQGGVCGALRIVARGLRPLARRAAPLGSVGRPPPPAAVLPAAANRATSALPQAAST